MKKTIYPLALASLLAISAIAYAEESDRGPRPRLRLEPEEVRGELRDLKRRMEVRSSSTTLRAEFEGRKASSTTRREERKASSTARRIEVQQGIAVKQMERAERVLTATIEHLEDILARVESRIAKVKAAGGNTAESESFVAEVKTHLSAAKVELAAFSSIQITSDKASENFEAVRVSAKGVKKHIKEAHQSLMKAIRALKPGRDEDRNASSTNATSTEDED